MKAEYLNPFLLAAKEVLKMVADLDIQKKSVSLRELPFVARDVAIVIAVVGDIEGQVIYCFDQSTALEIAKRMLAGFEVDGWDELTKSAISELANMISGNASGYLEKAGVTVDISPPSVVEGKEVKITTSVPTILLLFDSAVGEVEVNLSLKENN